jgi:ubiquinone/menaquinone biosynthesis C-methylase UbiE
VPDLENPVRMLDVGTGGGDMARDLLVRARRHGRRLSVVATDIRPEIVAYARQAGATPNTSDNLSIELVDPGPIAAADGSFDIAHASLVLHHLEAPRAVDLLADMGRVARRAVIVNDLERGWPWFMAARALATVATRNRYTRHDGPLSVRRAYSRGEVAKMARQAGLRLDHTYSAMPPYRYALVFVPVETVAKHG